MHCDIWISSIDRNHQSGRISDRKLTLCHSSATEIMLLMVLLCFPHKHVVSDRQSTKTIVVFPHILLCLFLDNLARLYCREKNLRHRYTHMLLCENKSAFIESFSVSPWSLWRGKDHFKETCCRFLLGVDVANCFAVKAIWIYFIEVVSAVHVVTHTILIFSKLSVVRKDDSLSDMLVGHLLQTHTVQSNFVQVHRTFILNSCDLNISRL